MHLEWASEVALCSSCLRCHPHSSTFEQAYKDLLGNRIHKTTPVSLGLIWKLTPLVKIASLEAHFFHVVTTETQFHHQLRHFQLHQIVPLEMICWDILLSAYAKIPMHVQLQMIRLVFVTLCDEKTERRKIRRVPCLSNMVWREMLFRSLWNAEGRSNFSSFVHEIFSWWYSLDGGQYHFLGFFCLSEPDTTAVDFWWLHRLLVSFSSCHHQDQVEYRRLTNRSLWLSSLIYYNYLPIRRTP